MIVLNKKGGQSNSVGICYLDGDVIVLGNNEYKVLIQVGEYKTLIVKIKPKSGNSSIFKFLIDGYDLILIHPSGREEHIKELLDSMSYPRDIDDWFYIAEDKLVELLEV